MVTHKRDALFRKRKRISEWRQFSRVAESHGTSLLIILCIVKGLDIINARHKTRRMLAAICWCATHLKCVRASRHFNERATYASYIRRLAWPRHIRLFNLTDRSCSFDRPFMLIWPSVHVHLTDRWCSFDRPLMLIWPSVHAHLTVRSCSFDRPFMLIWPSVHAHLTVCSCSFDRPFMLIWPSVHAHLTVCSCSFDRPFMLTGRCSHPVVLLQGRPLMNHALDINFLFTFVLIALFSHSFSWFLMAIHIALIHYTLVYYTQKYNSYVHIIMCVSELYM